MNNNKSEVAYYFSGQNIDKAVEAVSSLVAKFGPKYNLSTLAIIGFRVLGREYTKLVVSDLCHLASNLRKQCNKFRRSKLSSVHKITIFDPSVVQGNQEADYLSNVFGIKIVKIRDFDSIVKSDRCLVKAMAVAHSKVIRAITAATNKETQTKSSNNMKNNTNKQQFVNKANRVQSAQITTTSGIIYPVPEVTLPQWSLRDLIRCRITEFVALTSGSDYFDYDHEEYRTAWKRMWRLFGMRMGINLTTIQTNRQKQDVYNSDSLLDIAEEKGLLPQVYAFVCDTYYVEPMLPRLSASGTSSRKKTKTTNSKRQSRKPSATSAPAAVTTTVDNDYGDTGSVDNSGSVNLNSMLIDMYTSSGDTSVEVEPSEVVVS